MEYHSQYGQDSYIDNYIFNNLENGFFVDIGAYDGKRLSNTYFFEKVRNWSGVCFEPNPRIYKKLIENRTCKCINGAVSDIEGDFDFLDIEGVEVLGGLMSKYDKRHLERVERDFYKYNGISKNLIKVKCYSLNRILETLNINEIDYCSIDTEGGELDIIKSFNFNKFKIKVLSIENNFRETNQFIKLWKELRYKTVESYLNKKGYRKLKSLGSDDIYILKSLLVDHNS